MADDYLAPVDLEDHDFVDLYDELPLWSAMFGMLLMERIPLRRDMTVVDVGTGTGWAAIELAERCGPDATVYAVDPWRPALARLQRKLDQRGIRNVRVVAGSVEDVDLPDGLAEVVVCNLGINNFPDPPASLAACRRLLRSGGTLAMTTNLSGHLREFYDVFAQVLEEAGLDDRLPALAEHIAHRGTVESVTALLSDANFDVSPAVTDSFRMRFATGGAFLRHRLVRVGFVPAWKRVVPEASVADVFDRLERELDRIAAEQGELTFTVPMAYVEAYAAGDL